MLIRKLFITLATFLSILSFPQRGLARPPKTFTESKIIFFVTLEPTYVSYAEKDGLCLVPSGTAVYVVNKIKNTIYAQLRVPPKPSKLNLSTPCADNAVVKMSESQLVEAYNFMADWSGYPDIAVDVEPAKAEGD